MKDITSQFKQLVNVWKNFDIGEAFDNFIEAIKNLPKKVLDLKKIGRKILRTLDEYVDLPPVVQTIKELVEYVSNVFHDIKSDVMEFYHVSGIYLNHMNIH